MKVSLLISSLVLPLYLSACGSKKNESTKVEDSPKDVPAETVKIEKPADEKNTEELPIETEEQTGEVSGAVLGASIGGIIGHQSGAALEGAAIGAAAGEIEYQPDEEEEE